MDLLSKIRTVPDFPKPGIQFKDITTLLADGPAFQVVIDRMAARYQDAGITKIVGVESRGFMFGCALAYKMKLGFIPIRKKGKLPFTTHAASYSLEYGEASVEIHTDALGPNDRVVLVDDLLATGGTLEAAAGLVKECCGAEVHEIWVLMELGFLNGRQKLSKYAVYSELMVQD